MLVAGASLNSSFHVMAKPIGSRCNLDCDYCFYLEKEIFYSDRKNTEMSDRMLEHYISQYIASQPTDIVTFTWQGGEPTLLGVDFFQKTVAFQKNYAKGKIIDNTFQTNGVLINDTWASFLKKEGFLVGVSIDGPKELHNKYRLNKGRQGSFDQVKRGINCLRRHQVEFNTLTVVQSDNVLHPEEVYKFLKSIGSRFMQFIPIVERWHDSEKDVANDTSWGNGKLENHLHDPSQDTAAKITKWSVPAAKYGGFLNDIFDQWVRNDVGHYFVQIFDTALGNWANVPGGLCVFQETCGTALAIEHNGDVYSCDHYVYPDYRLGNIEKSSLIEMVNSHRQRKFGQEKKDNLPNFCKNCEVLTLCNGECPKHRFVDTFDGQTGLNYLCPSYKNFFTHTAPYMKYMANELANRRSPASVMKWTREKDLGFPNHKVGRNDPCPCDSGKKYKQCCRL